MDNLDLTAKINFDKIFELDNPFSLFIYILQNNGAQATSLMGDYQVASNIEAVDSWRMFELFTQKIFFDNKISILAGLYDLNSEFDILRPATLSLNSSFGIGGEYGQVGRNGPSIFPVSSLGVRFASMLGNSTKFKLAILDVVPGNQNNIKSNRVRLSWNEGALIASEISIYTNSSFYQTNRKNETRRQKVGRGLEHEKNNKINIGTWFFTDRFEIINDSLQTKNVNFGIYIGFQNYFDISSDKYISYFLRFGIANPKFNNYYSAFSGGIVISNPFLDFDDYFGLGFSSIKNSDNYQSFSFDFSNIETAFEFSYVLPIRSWVLVQPNLQYIINPSTNESLENPFSIALLVQLSLGN